MSNDDAKGPILDTGLAELNSRLQPLLLFFIDGASIIDGHDPKWILHYLHAPEGHVVAFCSAYPFLRFPDKVRLRISQFLVLPPFQRQGLGSLLYRRIVRTASQVDNDDSITAAASPNSRRGGTVEEITVEDPSEAFSDFRLANDLAMVDAGLPVKLTVLQREEIQLMATLRDRLALPRPGGQEEEEFAGWRRAVKRLLCKRYPDVAGAPKEERVKVLERLFVEELDRYRRILKLAPIYEEVL